MLNTRARAQGNGTGTMKFAHLPIQIIQSSIFPTFYWDLMGFNGDLMGFYSDSMGY
jgi:hypothetical protein